MRGRVEAPADAGFHRVAWDLRYPALAPIDLEPSTEYNPYADVALGPLAAWILILVGTLLLARG